VVYLDGVLDVVSRAHVGELAVPPPRHKEFIIRHCSNGGWLLFSACEAEQMGRGLMLELIENIIGVERLVNVTIIFDNHTSSTRERNSSTI
jgi:hypothetical protein